MLDVLKTRLERKNMTEEHFNELMGKIEAYKIWRLIPPDKPYGDKKKMFAGEGFTKEQIEKIVALGSPGNPTGSNQYVIVERKVDNVNIPRAEGGNKAEYLLRRLKRDRPDILEAYGRGEYPSVRQAAIAAGIVKVDSDLTKVLKLLLKLNFMERERVREVLFELDKKKK
jgi:hypothetical protein